MSSQGSRTIGRQGRKKPTVAETAAVAGLKASAAFVDPERRRSMIAQAAYYRAERRGFQPGRELEDWYAAEAEIAAIT
jgi:hypothetical protein